MGEDPFQITRQQVCDETFYFNNVFSSSNYYVYSLCTDQELTDCEDTLAKVYQLKPNKKMNAINIEADCMKLASDLGVSPTFLGLRYCMYDNKPYAVLIMSKYGDGNLTSLIQNGMYETHKDDLDAQLKRILDRLYDYNIDHNDLHTDNILYKMTDKGIELKIIDFDTSRPLNGRRRTYRIEDAKGGPAIRLDISGKTRKRKHRTNKNKVSSYGKNR